MILAVDPGITGAFAWITDDGHLVEIMDMPTTEVRGKRRISASLVRDIMMRRAIALVAIEAVGPMPKEASAGSFAFGYGAGILEGVAAGLALPVQMVTSAVWKRGAGLSSDKGVARQMAQRYWPGAAKEFARVKDHGRAEAALLGRWAALR
jgi:crossover junction endodeoxyribonuclease RuvC